MKKTLVLIVFILIASRFFGQTRVVINNNGYIVIDNSAFVVLENSNPNALTISGTGANILSEKETDVIKWEIGTTIGTYTIPWTTSSGIKIPLSINKTTAGTGATSEFILSTWETSDANLPVPSAVTNMNYNGVDKSLFVADRFWHIDALSYTVKPSVTLSIAYNSATNEIGPGNTITETNLLAQRFNTGLGHWESYLLFGANNAGADRVDNIVVTPIDFFEDWILVDATNPLPVEVMNFETQCENEKMKISWTTTTEINNDYFEIEKSNDAQNYFLLGTVNGAGNSNSIINYSIYDDNPSTSIAYYRLKQVDFDGTFKYHNHIVSGNCKVDNFNISHMMLNNNSLSFIINTTEKENLNIFFYDYQGKLIAQKSTFVVEGSNSMKINDLDLSNSIYILSIVGEQNSKVIKLMNFKK